MGEVNATDLGCLLWEQLGGAFMEIALANGLDTPAKRARLYAAFIGSVGGSMAADLGVADSSFVLDMLKEANIKLAREQLHVVKGAGDV
ncbi:hypothetical protein [Stutzerimonas nitrititolerans]|uniref:hypothetical protein n=1 Tax=Stutzerimonas nitrititolerans TaxID=2482751 RepID=UPI0028AF9517|nr:hypothetical protein [Stutzerimonas nitrititolerans]